MLSLGRRSFILFGLASAFGSSVRAYQKGHSRLGVNFSVVDIDKARIPSCSLHNEHGATFVGHAFLPRYAMVRDRVKRTLHLLRDHGADSIRCLIWFNATRSQSGDTVSIDDGESVGRNLTLFGNDMVEVGISRLMVAFGPQGPHFPGCRQVTWGDCFIPRTLQETFRFIFDVRAAFVLPRKLSLWLDLLNEGAPADNLPPAIKDQFLKFMNYVVPKFRAQYPDDRISISMQAGQLTSRIRYLLENFDPSGIGPDFYSVHLYKSSSGNPLATLQQLLPTIRERPRPLFVGEIEDDPGYYLKVDSYLRSAIPEQYYGLMVWPLQNPGDLCSIDTDAGEIDLRSSSQ
jgi:hypothetical protein